MTRLKTTLFWIFVVLALGTGAYAYFHLKNNKKPRVDALSVLPDNCLLYFNTRNFFELDKKINSQSLIVDKLKLFSEIDALCNSLHTFDSLFSTNEALAEVLKDNVIHFACYKEKQSWLAAFNIKQLGEEEDLAEQLARILKAQKGKAEIYAFQLKTLPLYFHLNAGVVTVSNTQELILHALDSKQARLYKNKDFIQFETTLREKSLLSVYVNHQLYAESAAATHLNLSFACRKGCSAGVISLEPSQIRVNGYLVPTEDELIALFRDQAPQPSKDLANDLPYATKFFKAFGFSSYPELKIGFPSTHAHIEYWMKANEKGLYNVEDEFNVNLVNQLVEFETQVPGTKFISAEVNDTLKAAEHLRFMSDSSLKENACTIYHINDSLGHPLQLFTPLSQATTNYALLYQTHLYFAESSNALMQLLRELKSGQMLSNNESFMAYQSEYFPDDFNYLIYNSPSQLVEDIPSFFNFKQRSAENPFENFKHFSFSVSSTGNAFTYRLHLMNETESHTKEQNVLWTLNLDAETNMPAAGYVNHITGENELVIQDENNTLYLVNAKGTILWKKKLNEKINSTIYTVDIYKKNKFQLLFNTRNYLHLIDRNGNYVKNYPVKLPAEASGALSLFDYDANKDYRLFISCRNKTTYNYSIHGQPQEKFSAVKTDAEVDLPVQYVQVGTSDYLVAVDKEGKIYTFSRKGVGRIGLRNRVIVGCRAFYADACNSIGSTHLVYVDDKNGLLDKISFEDKKDIIKLHSEIENADLNFQLVDDNRNMDLIITKGNGFQAFNLSGNLITEKTTEFPLSKTSFYSDESHAFFYALSEDKTQLILFDQIQNKTRSFKANALPLISNLFNDHKKYMILSNGRQLSCVLLN